MAERKQIRDDANALLDLLNRKRNGIEPVFSKDDLFRYHARMAALNQSANGCREHVDPGKPCPELVHENTDYCEEHLIALWLCISCGEPVNTNDPDDDTCSDCASAREDDARLMDRLGK